MVIEESAGEFIGAQPSVLDTIDGHLRENKHWLALAAGSGLLLLGARSRRSLPLALIGAVLVYRGSSGRWPFSELFGLDSNPRPHPATSVPYQAGIKEERAIIIDRAPQEIYRYWRQVENLPRFMGQHVSVERLGDKRSHWKFQSVGGKTFEWDAEIINDVPNELLAWRSLEGADLDHAGSVHFESAPHGGTKVTVIMEYRPPAGRIGAELAGLFGQKPGQVIDKNLQQLKRILESGQVTPVTGQPGTTL